MKESAIMATNDPVHLDLREKLARIDQMLAAHDRDRAQINTFSAQHEVWKAQIEQMAADRDRKRQEIKWQPWQVAFMGMTAGAALFVAGGAFVKVFLP